MYHLNVNNTCIKIFRKLAKRDSKQLAIIEKKVLEIRSNPFHEYKSLHHPFQGRCRVHIDSHFVLVFRIDHDALTVYLLDYNHHNYIYK
jgi:mRNA-degrading endonuclease RelE of RelBE toxin-antitoxin system